MTNPLNAERNGNDWKSSKVIDGIRSVDCDSWSGFSSFIHEQLTNFDSYIYRGHANTSWKLEPTIDRVVDDQNNPIINIEKHLEKFKHATRGRRGANPNIQMSDNDWWALGQHHGLYTPLLDWSESPFVASYFALIANDIKWDERVVVYALSRNSCERKNVELRKHRPNNKNTQINTLDFIRPLTDENSRLISQRGLFTRAPSQTTIDEWITSNFNDSTMNGAPLLKIYIPAYERVNILKSLNLMNVNHLSLFPDLDGASKYCNTSATIKQYG